MPVILQGRLFAAWTVLVAVTLISSQLGAWLGSAAAITAAVLAIAFAKAGAGDVRIHGTAHARRPPCARWPASGSFWRLRRC